MSASKGGDRPKLTIQADLRLATWQSDNFDRSEMILWPSHVTSESGNREAPDLRLDWPEIGASDFGCKKRKTGGISSPAVEVMYTKYNNKYTRLIWDQPVAKAPDLDLDFRRVRTGLIFLHVSDVLPPLPWIINLIFCFAKQTDF